LDKLDSTIQNQTEKTADDSIAELDNLIDYYEDYIRDYEKKGWSGRDSQMISGPRYTDPELQRREFWDYRDASQTLTQLMDAKE